ncbi:MAG: hypothetical protein U0840_03830 [Gemmataceae bacterium]
MSGWDWFDEYEFTAQFSGEAERQELGRLHREAYTFRESDPDQALTLIRRGRALAEHLREPWWMLYYDQQRVHALLHFKQDYREVLDLAVRNALELRRPANAEFPRRLMIHGDLVQAYLGIDPLGYAESIAQALDYLEAETPPDSDEYYLLLGSRRQFALDRGAMDEAAMYGQRSLELAAADPERGRAEHFLVFAWSGLCEVAWHRREAEALAEAAATGKELAQRVGHQVELAGFWVWQALVEQLQGGSSRGELLMQRARQRLEGLGMPADASIQDAKCAYYEMAGRFDEALAARDREWRQLEGRGRLAREAACLLSRARLLTRLGRLDDETVARTRQAIERLRQPEPGRAALARLLRGEVP